MFTQLVLVCIFLGLMALASLSIGLLLASLIQLLCFGSDKLISKIIEAKCEIDDKLGGNQNEK